MLVLPHNHIDDYQNMTNIEFHIAVMQIQINGNYQDLENLLERIEREIIGLGFLDGDIFQLIALHYWIEELKQKVKFIELQLKSENFNVVQDLKRRMGIKEKELVSENYDLVKKEQN